MQKNLLPIGVFDSGLGGLTSVREIKKIMPDEDIIYFGDTGRLPYGTRSPEIIKKYACDDMNFLLTSSVKAVLVACGTVSSTALGVLRDTFDLPIFGVVEPAAQSACRETACGRIAVLATPSTVRTGAFEREINKISPKAEVMSVGCPMFVPLVENGYIQAENPVTRHIVREYLSNLKDFRPDVIILGCTHYPIIRDIIHDQALDMIGEVSIVDSGASGAMAVKGYLEKNGLLTSEKCGRATYYVSDEPHGFENTATLFLGEAVKDAVRINIDDYLYEKSAK